MNKLLSFYTVLVILFTASPVNAQLQVEWEGPANSTSVNTSSVLTDWDIDGDGIREICGFTTRDGMTFLVAVNGANPHEQWEFALPREIASNPNSWTLIGFYPLWDEIQGFNLKEAVFTDDDDGNTVIIPLVPPFSHVELGGDLVGIADYDLDNELEVLVFHSDEGTIEMWGRD